MADMFAPDSVIRRVNIEPCVALGGGRALLLQLAHPAVARGVQDHSDFKANPLRRLLGTLEAVNAVVFGSEELAAAVGARIQRIHSYVTGPGYAANDPSNLLWVHATLVDTALVCYSDFAGPLDASGAEAYYQQMTRVAEVFGVPRSVQPPSLAAFRSWFADAVAGLEVTDVGRELGAFVVAPSLPWRLDVPLAPLLGFERRLSIGRLPASVREQFGFAWSAREGRALERSLGRARAVYRRVPRAVRTAPTQANGRYLLWLASRHVRDGASPRKGEG